MHTLIRKLREELRQNSDEGTRLSGQRFFKEEVLMYGIKSAIVSEIGKRYYREIRHLSREAVFRLCEELWHSGYMEESFVACNWSYNKRKELEPSDMKLFERWVEQFVSNWAACDTFCNHTVGFLVEKFPALLKDLKRWARSENRWMKRASAVSLIVPARKGLFLPDVFEIADILLLDQDDMVQKGYGWMLKVASQQHQKEVFEYVLGKKTVMLRTVLRYAIEKMPGKMKKDAMKRA